MKRGRGFEGETVKKRRDFFVCCNYVRLLRRGGRDGVRDFGVAVLKKSMGSSWEGGEGAATRSEATNGRLLVM